MKALEKAIWNQAWHGVNIKSCEVMVLVQLFIIRIALSNWAAPSYPFSLLLYYTAAPPLSWGAHKHTLVLGWCGWQILSSLLSEWFTCHATISHSSSLNASSWTAIKSGRNAPIFPSWLLTVYMFSPQLYRHFTGAKLLLPFSQIHSSISSSSSLLFHTAFSFPDLCLSLSPRVAHLSGWGAVMALMPGNTGQIL